MLSEKLITELKQIIREDYGEKLGNKDTARVGNSLISLFQILITNKDKNDHKQRK